MKDDLFPETVRKPCVHLQTRITSTPHLQHHAREDCIDCGKFLRWLPKPETLERASINNERLDKLSEVKTLSEWEKGFVKSVRTVRSLSPKQQETLDKICKEHGI